MFRKILIANRGEIAVRVIRACREMGISSVAVFSAADRASLHVRMADEAVAIGPAAAAESYLDIERILDAARASGAEAVHPGYGFLSENAEFAAACEAAGLRFIGPPAEAIRLMGSKTEARARMAAAGLAVIPGESDVPDDPAAALAVAERVGFPVMVKAVAGGGGKGMRLIGSRDEFPAAFEMARSEARNSFADDRLYIERAIPSPRHVEVQILADAHGSLIHLGERECSLQRRHQKVLEETPSPLLVGHEAVRDRLTAAAVEAARAAGYVNAGTVEFLMDEERNFYFLEMNARLQVEHPVTELVTGVDLVQEQIRIAAGERLRYTQEEIRPRGWAMECRVYAEDPANDFLPSPGVISALRRPAGPGVRVDSAAYPGWEIPVEYDPLIAKLSAWAPTRAEVVARLRAALEEYHIGGVRTTLELFRWTLADAEFQRGEIDTGYLERLLARRSEAASEGEDQGGELEQAAGLLAAAARFAASSSSPSAPPAADAPEANRWKTLARRRMLR